MRAARAGGEVAIRRLKSPGYLRWKGERDVVSEAVLRVQDAIVAVLSKDTPAAAVLAEEGPEDARVPVDAPHLWIVDPICGSLNFAHGIPHFGISIALRSGGGIRAAVVYDPCRNELFAATDVGNATLNGGVAHVQQIGEGAEAWSGALVGADLPSGGERRRRAAVIFGLMADQVSACVAMGSPALGLCYVAAGRLHAYWHLDLNIWDVAAASLIAQRAGATFTDTAGMSWIHSEGDYLSTNGIIQNATQNCIQAVPGAR
jgi:myo-inositol-1(or 4)-monophosphatase